MQISRAQTLIKKWKIWGSVDTKPQLGRPIKISGNYQENWIGKQKKTYKQLKLKKRLHCKRGDVAVARFK